MRRLYYFAICVFVTGCATIPPLMQDVVESQQSIYANYNKVWVEVNNYFSDRDIPVKSANTDLGIIETEGVKTPYEGFKYKSDYCDCGSLGGIYVYREIRGQFNANIQRVKENVTLVRFEANYRASLWAANKFIGWVECQSKGYMERKFFDQMNTTFKPPTPPKKSSSQTAL